VVKKRKGMTPLFFLPGKCATRLPFPLLDCRVCAFYVNADLFLLPWLHQFGTSFFYFSERFSTFARFLLSLFFLLRCRKHLPRIFSTLQPSPSLSSLEIFFFTTETMWNFIEGGLLPFSASCAEEFRIRLFLSLP